MSPLCPLKGKIILSQSERASLQSQYLHPEQPLGCLSQRARVHGRGGTYMTHSLSLLTLRCFNPLASLIFKPNVILFIFLQNKGQGEALSFLCLFYTLNQANKLDLLSSVFFFKPRVNDTWRFCTLIRKLVCSSGETAAHGPLL